MKKLNKTIIFIFVLFLIILLPQYVMASDGWKDYIGKDIRNMWNDEFQAVAAALYDADITTMSKEDKEDYIEIIDKWLSNSLASNPDYSSYSSEFENRKSKLNSTTTDTTITTTPTPTTSTTTPTTQKTPTTDGNADEGEFIYGTEGVQDDWESLVDRNAFNTTDLAVVAPLVESYIKDTDISTINKDNIDKYLKGLKMILNNTGLKTDTQYKALYTMVQDRLKKLEQKSDITNAQRNTISSLIDKAEASEQDNIGNNDGSYEAGTTNEKLDPQTGSKPVDSTTYNPDEKTSPDDVISEGSDFISAGKNNQNLVTINGDKLKSGSNMLFNIAFSVGVVIAIGIGTYLGIKFMLSGAEEKATIKESLIPYFAGVIIMFASFSIWKLVLVLMQAIDNI